jgi:hypothetical protein
MIDEGFFDNPLQLDPIWRQAAAEALTEFAYGDVISQSWIYQHLAIRDMKEGKYSADEYQEVAFDLLRKVDGFRDELLRKHNWYLINVRGAGYKIIEPPYQTTAAMGKLHRELRKSISQAMAALVHIDQNVLSLETAKENADARAKLGAFTTLHVKQLIKS